MWRPKSWRKDYGGEWRKIKFLDESFENGADAMLLAVSKKIDLENVKAYGQSYGACTFLWEEEVDNES